LKEFVSTFKYLGDILNEKWDWDEEVKIRTGTAKNYVPENEKYTSPGNTTDLPSIASVQVLSCCTEWKHGHSRSDH